MLGNAKELEKGFTYSAEEWDTPRRRIKAIKKGKAGVVIKHDDDTTVTLKNTHAVRFYEPGRDPKKVKE